MNNAKILLGSDLAGIVIKAKHSGKTVGFTNGCFDILHVGHVRYLRDARSECDLLIVGVNSDDSVKRLKGPDRPVNRQDARMEVLSALECVSYVTMFEEDTPETLIKLLTPDVIFKGGDWKEADIIGGDHVKKNGGRVRVIPFVSGYSTTGTINKIKK